MQAKCSSTGVDYSDELDQDIVRLARLALEGGVPEVQPLLRRLARRYRQERPALVSGLVDLLRESPLRSAALRKTAEAQPVDRDSRIPLVREELVPEISVEPVFPDDVTKLLDQLVRERHHRDRLAAAGLAPTRTALFVGPPGVGKTLAARWVARSLALPLITLDLSSVMSSYLGRTGDNLRRVMDYAKIQNCVLLLDELDAVAKRRDDAGEIGELKRLVTVLLQEVDYWPEGALLIAATNHANLLDPAVWRRFEVTINFPYPSASALSEAARRYLDGECTDEAVIDFIGSVYTGSSFSELEQTVKRALRTAAIEGTTVNSEIVNSVGNKVKSMPADERIAVALDLVRQFKFSQRRAHDLTGVSRDTIRRRLAADSASEMITDA